MIARGCVLVSLVCMAPAQATPSVNLEAAADHQVSAQGTYPGGVAQSWEWRFGSKRSAQNITGVVAHGLLAAHRITGLSEHQNSALRAARSLIKAYDGGWKTRRPKTQDIEFLAAAGYLIDAARWFTVTTQRWTGPGYVDFVIAGRGIRNMASLSGWDVASAIRAALAVGQSRYAHELLARLVERRGQWDRPDRARASVLSAASLLWAISELKRRDRLSADEAQFAESLYRRVLAHQAGNGAIKTGDGKALCTQTTAYAAIGLAAWKASAPAHRKARRWLRKVALTDKHFFSGGTMWATRYSLANQPGVQYNSEVQSEVMMALAR